MNFKSIWNNWTKKRWWWLWYLVLAVSLGIEMLATNPCVRKAIEANEEDIYYGYAILTYLVSILIVVIGIIYMLVKYWQIKNDMRKGSLATYELAFGIIWGVPLFWLSVAKGILLENGHLSLAAAFPKPGHPMPFLSICSIFLGLVFFNSNLILCLCLHVGIKKEYKKRKC